MKYERTLNFGDDDNVFGVVGQWSEEGSHGNFGGRSYTKESDFVADILKING